MDHATITYVYDGIAFAPVSAGVIAHSTDASTCEITPHLLQVRYALCTRGVGVQSACLAVEVASRNRQDSNQASGTPVKLKRLCGDANQLAISRNDSFVQDGTFARVRLLFSWSRACFMARFETSC